MNLKCYLSVEKLKNRLENLKKFTFHLSHSYLFYNIKKLYLINLWSYHLMEQFFYQDHSLLALDFNLTSPKYITYLSV